jgi:DNA-directed RNA polymerase
MIHDSYGTHACNATRLSNALRYEFVNMYEKDVLASFLNMVDLEGLDIPQLPPLGTLDIKEVLRAKYFFA